MGKSNRQKTLGKMVANEVAQKLSSQKATPIKRNDARMTIRVEKKMVDGKETIHSSLECDEYEMPSGEAMPLKKEYSTAEELKAAVDGEIDKLYKKVK
jgi:hypothetical protein